MIEDAERAVSSLQDTPRGLLRVTAGANAGWLAPIISDYLKRYPEVRLDLYCTGRRVDLVEEGFDLGIRAGTLADSTLIARSLGTATWFFVAAPAYLKKRGRPRVPDDLRKHACLVFSPESAATVNLRFVRGDESVQVALSPRLLTGEMPVLGGAALAGVGIALLPAFGCVDDLRAHRLERVLRDWTFPSTPVHIIYPSTRQISPKVKSFVDHLQAGMTPPPWELGPVP